ncbi:MAG: hypothetical protein HYZ38_04735 [Mycobacterium sp.]|nr:hypothetical protein [Mycobacterium sp.]
MAAIRDPDGVSWTLHRRLWPFPDITDLVDVLFFSWAMALLVIPFAILWPFWLVTKFLGARWRIIIVRDGVQVDEELVRGWRRSGGRIAELALEIGRGYRSGRFVVV